MGVLLRLREYLSNRSLWLDEASLSLNILGLSYRQLLGELDLDQGAAPGFLFIEKFLTDVLGPGESVLRLAPLLFGIAALILVYVVGRRFIGDGGALLAVGLFAVVEQMIRYSAEVKQYSLDVAITLALLWVGARCLDPSASVRKYIELALAGATALWASHAAMFASAGIGVVLFARALVTRSPSMLAKVAIPGLVWVASFVPLFALSLSHLLANDLFRDFWASGYAPLMPTSPDDLLWYYNATFSVLTATVGLESSAIGLFGLLVGAWALASQRHGLWPSLLLVSPIVATWVVSGFGLYPIAGRMVLFMAPIILLVIATGLTALFEKSRIVGSSAVLAISITPLGLALHGALDPRGREELRPVLEFVDERRVDDDQIFVYPDAQRALRYYSDFRDIGAFPAGAVTVGRSSRDDWNDYRGQLQALQGRGRTWIVFSHVHAGSGADEEKLFLFILDQIGNRLDAVNQVGASAYLYDLSNDYVTAELPTPQALNGTIITQ